MSVDSVKKQFSDDSRYWQRVHAKEKKLINENHQEELKKIKETQQAELDQQRAENRVQLAAESDRQAQELSRIRADLDTTQQTLEKQKDFLVERGQRQIADKKELYQGQLENTDNDFQQRMDQQTEKHKELVARSNYAFNDEQVRRINNQKEALNEMDQQHDHQLKEKAGQLKQRAEHEDKVGQNQLRNIKSQNKTQFEAENAKWKQKFRNLNATNQTEQMRQEKAWKKSFDDQKTQHQTLYKDTANMQAQEMKHQMDLNSREVAKIKQEASTELVHINQRKSDPFYRNNELDYTLTEKPEHYELHIAVPEHEKDSYLLNAYERSLNLSFNRSFKEDVHSDDGAVTKTSRVESYNRSIPVSAIVKANSISKNYQNGVLTFIINKA